MISVIKKRYYKPLYKNFISLKKNVQNRRRLNLLKFKTRKWEKLILYIRRLQNRRKRNFLMYDTDRYFLPKFYNSFKKKYKNVLQNKKKIKLFYGGLSDKNIKHYLKIFLSKKNKILVSFKNLNSFFISLLEQRLDVILYRCYFTLSIRAAKQLISQKHVKVNGIVVKNNCYIIKKGDFIEIKSSGFNIVEFSIENSHLWPIPPKYLYVNYKTLQIICVDKIDSNFSIYFPLWLDLYAIKNFY